MSTTNYCFIKYQMLNRSDCQLYLFTITIFPMIVFIILHHHYSSWSSLSAADVQKTKERNWNMSSSESTPSNHLSSLNSLQNPKHTLNPFHICKLCDVWIRDNRFTASQNNIARYLCSTKDGWEQQRSVGTPHHWRNVFWIKGGRLVPCVHDVTLHNIKFPADCILAPRPC